jgi:hypothetical protein
MHLRPLTPAEASSIENTRAAYRAMWAKLKTLPPCAFVGGREDLDALDFIDYEGLDHPEGLQGAAIIWGGVIAATGALRWAVGDESHFVLTIDEGWPRTVVCPYSRVAELAHSQNPQYGKYEWAMEEAVLRLLDQGFSDEIEARLTALLSSDADGFLDRARPLIDRLLTDKQRRHEAKQREIRDELARRRGKR